MKRLFITGGSGLLGSKFIRFSDKYEVITTYNSNPRDNAIKLDITNDEQVINKIESLSPDVVVHSAALTNVDYCEDHQEEAYKINAQGTLNMAKACQKVDSKLIYVSTDFVFDGREGLYSEDHQTNPLSYYGLSKLKGEEFVKDSGVNYAIARVSVLYGWHTNFNYVTWVINELKAGNQINIVTDEYNSPTYADNAAEALLKIFTKDKKGIYHIAGNERINRFDFARNIAQVFELDPTLIKPIKSEDLIRKAQRPLDSSLQVRKAEIDLDIKLLNTKEGLKEMKGDVKK
ncbi:MAG: dTDP-4-dehydrorhamnose reductase [Methanobacterium sp.]|jgi:dTDP-4-dehydrorhamnose reductase|nr:dTDP-4-dehydrorhamnose reductase [Methanobacterium sp.]